MYNVRSGHYLAGAFDKQIFKKNLAATNSEITNSSNGKLIRGKYLITNKKIDPVTYLNQNQKLLIMLKELNLDQTTLKKPWLYELELVDSLLTEYGVEPTTWYEYLETKIEKIKLQR